MFLFWYYDNYPQMTENIQIFDTKYSNIVLILLSLDILRKEQNLKNIFILKFDATE